jgi:hypothetical protein
MDATNGEKNFTPIFSIQAERLTTKHHWLLKCAEKNIPDFLYFQVGSGRDASPRRPYLNSYREQAPALQIQNTDGSADKMAAQD